MSVSISALQTLVVFAQIILSLAFMLFISTTFSDSPIGQAFAVLTNA